MDKQTLIDRVKKGNFDNQQLLGWLGAMPNTPKKPTVYKIGDVFLHKIFRHPYVILKQRRGTYICGLLTSESDCSEILEICQSRFFENSYFTKTLFTVSEEQGNFAGVYENNKHLKEVFLKLKQSLLWEK